jgi:trk system potassium uptake protein TrkA
VIDIHDIAFQNLPSDFRGRTLEGEALNRDVLHRAGIEHTDGLAAVTSSDATNIVVCHIAHTYYNIHNIIARNYNSRFRPIYESFDIQVISSASWGAQRIEELLYHHELRSVFSAGNGEVEVYEFTIPHLWEGHSLEEILPAKECVLSAVTRAGRAMLPNRTDTVQAGDVILVSATLDGIEALRARLTAESPAGRAGGLR